MQDGLAYDAGLFALAAASKTSLIHSDLVLLAALATASISATSDSSNRQNSRASLDAPLGSGGLPLFAFLGIL